MKWIDPEEAWAAIERGETPSGRTLSDQRWCQMESGNAFTNAITRWATERTIEGRPLSGDTIPTQRETCSAPMSPEERRERTNEYQRRYLQRNAKHIQARQKAKWDSMTEEERAKKMAKSRDRWRAIRANLTTEQRMERNAKAKEYARRKLIERNAMLDAMTPDERKAYWDAINVKARERYAQRKKRDQER